MPDLFGKKQLGRATTGGRFYATPTDRVEAGAVYFPDESSLLFGVAEYTVEAGNLGAFATEGTFVFEKPSDWLDALGRKVFFRPSSGEIVNQDKKGDVLIGFQIFANVPDDKLGVVLTQGENSVVIMVTSTADSGAGSLRQAIADAQDGDVILFDADVFPVGQTTSILLSSYITVNKSISIYGGFNDGAGGYTSGAEKRFYVYREVDGVKTKVVITSPDAAQDGETVLFEVVCRVALDGQGATRAIYERESATCNFSGVAFVNGNGNGGGLYVYDTATATVNDCAFNACTGANGGGLYTAATAETTVNNCSFVSCSGTSGGALQSTSGSRNTLNGCIIDDCSAASGGGVFSAGTSQNTLNDCKIYGCSATSSGGGVYSSYTSQNTLNNCVISNCSATSGGAFYLQNASQNTLTDCIFDGCSATSNGGGVFMRDTSRNTLNDCTISDCTATNGGGVFSANTSQNTLNDCIISGCNASYGGGVYSTNASQNTLNACTITNCVANIYAGGVCVYSESQAILNGCTISGCTADTRGGGLYALNISQATLNDCVITGCHASLGAGTYFNNSGGTSIDSCAIYGNISIGASKDVLFDNSAVATISATQFGYYYSTAKATITFTSGVTTIATPKIDANAIITINDGAALTITTSATIGAATFTSAGRGYLAVGAGIDISSATLTGVVACSYGAGLESFDISADGASWTAEDLTTPILLEQKGDGDVWTTLSDDATGGSYSGSFEIGTTLRAFDGVRFFVASLDAYWQVEPFVVASNGGGGAGDASPSWTISDATITPNAEEV